MKVIRITSIYGEVFTRIELKRNKIGVYTDKGFVPFEDIEYIDIMGDIDTEYKFMEMLNLGESKRVNDLIKADLVEKVEDNENN